MADSSNVTSVRVEDLIPVGSRVSWGAVFAGAVVAMATYLVLSLLGGAIGMTVSDHFRGSTLATGAAVYAVVATVASLFLGGWVTSLCTVGENKCEAAIHGVIMWGVVVALIMWTVSTGMRGGFNAMVGISAFTRGTTADDWEAAARNAGVPQETINDWRTRAANAPAETRRAASDPQNQQAALDYATHATWWTLLGTLASMLGAIAGALVGAGPTFRLVRTSIGSGRASMAGQGRSFAGQPG